MTRNPEVLRTALHDLHVASGARMVDFGGWDMPVQYEGIISEHTMVRKAAGAFDVSHMGRLLLGGADAGALLQYLGTNDVASLDAGQARYSLVCNHEGGARDDVLIYRLPQTGYLMVVNASNREKMLAWLAEVRDELSRNEGRALAVDVDDITLETVMVGIQGPRAVELLRPLVQPHVDGLGYYRAQSAELFGGEGLISRTGYTGEDGFEVILDIGPGRMLWQQLTQLADSGELALAGLGARDTLRLEAGLPLYGHELDEDINPIEVGLSRFVKLSKGSFVGRDALADIAARGPARRLLGLVLEDGAIARQGSPVQAGDSGGGEVTSGSFSPTLGRSIAMALVDSAVSSELDIKVVVRGQAHPCRVVDLPFFHRRKRSQT